MRYLGCWVVPLLQTAIHGRPRDTHGMSCKLILSSPSKGWHCYGGSSSSTQAEYGCRYGKGSRYRWARLDDYRAFQVFSDLVKFARPHSSRRSDTSLINLPWSVNSKPRPFRQWATPHKCPLLQLLPPATAEAAMFSEDKSGKLDRKTISILQR